LEQTVILDILREAIAGASNPDDAVLKIQSTLGGSEVYIPVPDRKTRERNKQVKEAFNGRNHSEVCRKFHISLPTLYRVIGRRES
jgi:Mor family transcriptional regulator